MPWACRGPLISKYRGSSLKMLEIVSPFMQHYTFIIFIDIDIFLAKDIHFLASRDMAGANFAYCLVPVCRPVVRTPKNRQRLEFKFWIDSENALHSLIDRIQNRKRRRGTRCGIVRAAPAGGGIQIPDAIRCAAIEYTAFHPI